MDINELYTAEDHEAGAEMQVKGPDGKSLDMYITLAGIDSKCWRNAFSQSRRAIFRGEDEEEAEADALAKASLGWRGFQDKGVDIPFSHESVKQLYLNAPYIKDQADVFIATRPNFKKS